MTKKVDKIEKYFEYAVGRPWKPEDPNSSISFYAYGGQIQHGSLAHAIKFRDYCNDQEAADHKREKKPGKPPKYRIYQIVEIPDSENFK